MSAWDYATNRIHELGYKAKDIRSPSRIRPYVLVRVKLAQELDAMGHSYPEIARALGRKNHTSVMWYLGGLKGRRPPRRSAEPCFEDHICRDSVAA